MKTFVHILVGFTLSLLVLSTGTAHASGTYFSKSEVLKEFFPKSEKVSFTKFTPNASERNVLQRKLGYRLAKQSYYFFVATTGNSIDGYAFIDNQMGQHQPITFAVKLSPKGVVLRQEVMVYRESHGEEIRNARFRQQFTGKTVHDSLRSDRDIDSISGATISSRAITVGVRRTLVLFNSAILSPGAARLSHASAQAR